MTLRLRGRVVRLPAGRDWFCDLFANPACDCPMTKGPRPMPSPNFQGERPATATRGSGPRRFGPRRVRTTVIGAVALATALLTSGVASAAGEATPVASPAAEATPDVNRAVARATAPITVVLTRRGPNRRGPDPRVAVAGRSPWKFGEGMGRGPFVMGQSQAGLANRSQNQSRPAGNRTTLPLSRKVIPRSSKQKTVVDSLCYHGATGTARDRRGHSPFALRGQLDARCGLIGAGR